MNEQIHTTTPDTSRQGDDQQAAWLELARRQARTAAEIRIQSVQPFDWEAMERTPGGGWLGGWLFGPAASSRMRLSWALPALAVVVLGGATGTLAYVHLKQEVTTVKGSQLLEEELQPAAPATVRQPKRKLRTLPAPAPMKKPARLQRSKRKVSARKKVARKRPVVARKKVKEAPGTEPAARPSMVPGDIIFGSTDMPGGGEVIIVRPPSKLGPLFRTKDFKKGGPYGSGK